MPSLISTRRRTLSLMLALTAVHVLLISTQVQTRTGLPLIESVAFRTFAAVHRTAGELAGGVTGIWTGWVALHGVEEENERLHVRIAELEARVMGLEAIARSARALEEALALDARIAPPTRAARVVAGNPTPGMLTVLIDRGTADGVAADMAVISAEGVVGRVLGEPAARTARVELLVGRNAGAAATLERSGAGGLVSGGATVAGAPALLLDYVPNIVDVQPGERVFTSGQDGIYPPGFLVGFVSDARPGALFREVTVRPAVDVSRLDVVLVVLRAPGGGEAGAR